MLFAKKRKILKYLNEKHSDRYTAFDLILKDCVENCFKDKLTDMGITNAEVHIDWFDNIKSILVQAKYNGYFLNIDIDQTEFSLSADKDETDEDTVYELKTYGYFLETVKGYIVGLK